MLDTWLLLPLLPQAALTSVALGQLDQLKALPGGAQGLLDLIKDCPIMAEVSSGLGARPEDAWQAPLVVLESQVA